MALSISVMASIQEPGKISAIVIITVEAKILNHEHLFQGQWKETLTNESQSPSTQMAHAVESPQHEHTADSYGITV